MQYIYIMLTMDDRRMDIGRDELRHLLGIPPLAEIVIDYARYSESELVHRAISACNEPSCFLCEHVLDVYDAFCCWINVNPPSEEIAMQWGWPVPFNPEEAGKLSIGFGFGSYWDIADYVLPVTIDDLVPSRGLNIKTDFDQEREILDLCREQYLAQMREAMSQI